jgi:isochorismate synthase
VIKQKVLDEYADEGRSFVMFRIPGEEAPRLIFADEGDVHLLHDLSELNGRKGFVFAPFQVSDDCPIILMDYANILEQVQKEGYPKAFKLPPVLKKNLLARMINSRPMPEPDIPLTDDYAEKFRKFTEVLQNGRFDKLVLSRTLEEVREPEFSPEDMFYAACHFYPHSYVYIFCTPETGLWLGATPEILLSREGNKWHTVALAGTQSMQGEMLPQEWDEKNRQEQACVANYIRSQLLTEGIRAEENGPFPVQAGLLSHLKSDFYFTQENNDSLGNLLKLLHPTPAVCGLPKEEAYRFILENEGHERRYYSGFVGWLDPNGHTDLYVNLRCMNFDKQRVTLYAGGGLLTSSKLEEEWEETNKKLYTMSRLLTYVPYDKLYQIYKESCIPINRASYN